MPPLDTRKEAVVILVGLLVLLTLAEMWFSYRETAITTKSATRLPIFI
jgi:Mg2+/Co2+ transporter CorB